MTSLRAPSQRLGRIVFLLAGGFVVVGPGAAEARVARFDGTWTVVLDSETGGCGLDGSRYTLRVKNGRIRLRGDSGEQGQGDVLDTGEVSISAMRGLAQLDAAGALHRRTGGGTWSVSPIGCTGRWRASRR